MLQIDDKIISFDLFSEAFVCNYQACKGICCIEGDSGAPLEPGEAIELALAYPCYEDFLSDESKAILQVHFSETDSDGDLVTPLLKNAACAYSFTDEQGNYHCAVEKAHELGRTPFRKPISCHLYHIRISKTGPYESLNYHKWNVCAPARLLGKSENTPVFRFLKTPLVRKYGAEFYNELEIAYQELTDQKLI
jgi:hypothetical protein